MRVALAGVLVERLRLVVRVAPRRLPLAVRLVLVVCGLGLGAQVAAAQAASLYAYADGAGTPAGCPQEVTSSDGCSLATALSGAAAGDTVVLASPGGAAGHNYVGNWSIGTSGTSVASPVTIDGSAASDVTLDGNGGSSTDCPTGTCNGSVLTVTNDMYLTLKDLTIQNDSSANTGAIDNSAGGTVSITGVTFSHDAATGLAGHGGAIDNGLAGSGTVNVSGSTFVSDSAVFGGAIANGAGGGTGTVTVSDSTLSANSGSGHGGAIDNESGTVTVSSSTFSGNTSPHGPAIYSNDAVFVAGNIFADGCVQNSGSWTDAGFNVGADATCFNGPGDVDLGSASPLDLGPLASHGGATQTIAIDGSSKAEGIMANPTTVTLNGQSVKLCGGSSTDQRGDPRPEAGVVTCDAGAFQTQPAAPPPPLITRPASGAHYPQGSKVLAAYSCADGAGGPGLEPGVAGCIGDLAPGSPISTSAQGQHSFSARATSWDGLATIRTVTYTVTAPASPLRPTVSPAAVTVGPNTDGVKLSFSANRAVDGTVSILVPTVPSGQPWSPPQTTNSGDPGYVKVTDHTCHSASVTSVSGNAPGPWTIHAHAACVASQSFTITYGVGTTAPRLRAPTKSGSYAFSSTYVAEGASTPTALLPPPAVAVKPGPASGIDVALPDVFMPLYDLPPITTGPEVPPELLVVSVVDKYGNVDPAYSGRANVTWSNKVAPVCTNQKTRSMPENLVCFYALNTPSEPASVSISGGVGQAQVVAPLYYENCSPKDPSCVPAGYYGNSTGSPYNFVGNAPTVVTASSGGFTGKVTQVVSIGHFNVTGYGPTGNNSLTGPVPNTPTYSFDPSDFSIAISTPSGTTDTVPATPLVITAESIPINLPPTFTAQNQQGAVVNLPTTTPGVSGSGLVLPSAAPPMGSTIKIVGNPGALVGFSAVRIISSLRGVPGVNGNTTVSLGENATIACFSNSLCYAGKNDPGTQWCGCDQVGIGSQRRITAPTGGA
jgi:hypothetical protein